MQIDAQTNWEHPAFFLPINWKIEFSQFWINNFREMCYDSDFMNHCINGWVWILSFHLSHLSQIDETFPSCRQLLSWERKGRKGSLTFSKIDETFPSCSLSFPFPVAAFLFLSQLQPFLSQLFLAFPGNYPLGAVHIWCLIFGLAHFLTYLPTHVQFCLL